MGVRRPRTGDDWKLLAQACTALLERLPELVDEHVRELHEYSPAYGRVIGYDQHWQEAREAMRIGIETITAPPASPRRDLEHAEWLGRRRAEQGLPLELVVRAYRMAGHLVWDALLEDAGADARRLAALLQAATMVWSAVDAQADTASEAYRVTELELRRRTDEQLQALLDALLDGGRSPEVSARAAAGLDLPERGRYAVVVLRSERRDVAHRRLAGAGLRFIWRMRTDCEIGVVSLDEGTGLDALAELMEGRCRGPGGISPVVVGLTELGAARRLAELALRTCPADAPAIVRLDRRMPGALVVGQPELGSLLVSEVLGALLDLDPADRAVLLETLDVWLDCEGSAGRAASRLYCHRNTVFNRLRRLEQLTSRSLSRPRDLTEMTLALDAFRLTAGQGA
ncbi:PucR family transcriptional regulator [Streptomyces sp. CB03234]|uniref:PucR family transcriptional regulator n=1 Tax=Streptomyces sp. (strain CB03234) TaxID=1703937 RepID=UPI000938D045|nr:helix-turn-helix domain-containing protein [Streptomyces sp. CB03234]OKK04416.1 PucR family transcriptional regulator [Streptomyces sp. CB03234]